jgi:hypothetical protein
VHVSFVPADVAAAIHIAMAAASLRAIETHVAPIIGELAAAGALAVPLKVAVAPTHVVPVMIVARKAALVLTLTLVTVEIAVVPIRVAPIMIVAGKAALVLILTPVTAEIAVAGIGVRQVSMARTHLVAALVEVAGVVVARQVVPIIPGVIVHVTPELMDILM